MFFLEPSIRTVPFTSSPLMKEGRTVGHVKFGISTAASLGALHHNPEYKLIIKSVNLNVILLT